MQTFAGKAAPGADKLRGGYYTPEPIARFVAEWVATAGPRLLEPACGDGAMLEPLVDAAGPDAAVVGVELVSREAEAAARRTGVPVTTGDFFAWFDESRHGGFDGVAGNPPYVRFGSWDESQRAPALALMRARGMRPTRLTNAWVPFVAAALLAVRPGGRVGLVLPAELLQVGYAAELRGHLVDECARLTVVSFQRLVFPGIQQEVVLLLAERAHPPEADAPGAEAPGAEAPGADVPGAEAPEAGGPMPGPAQVRTVELADLDGLAALRLDAVPAVTAQLHGTEKWTQYFLEPTAVDVLRRVAVDSRLRPLRHYGDVDVGVVTGRNSFFCLTASDAAQLGLHDLTVPLVSRGAQLRGLSFTESELDTAATAARTRLLAPAAGLDPRQHPALAAYLAAGEVEGVPAGYKCRIRRTWWRVPSVWTADAFLLRQISNHPRLVANQTGATSTDTVHRVRLRPGVDASRLAVGAFNSVTFAFAEVLGRSYGGGVLELEPSEADALPVADPALVPPWLVAKADELVRDRRVVEALDLVDRVVLVDGLGFDPDEVTLLRSAWHTLRDRRTTRSRRP